MFQKCFVAVLFASEHGFPRRHVGEITSKFYNERVRWNSRMVRQAFLEQS